MAASASIAMSVKDNLSAAVKGMRNSLTAFRSDATELQKELDLLNAKKLSLKTDIDKTTQEAREARKAFLDLSDAERQTEEGHKKEEAWKQAEANLQNLRDQYSLVSKQVRATTKDFEEATGAIVRANNRAGGSGSGGSGGGGTGEQVPVLTALSQAGLLNMAGGVAGDWANTLIGSTFGSEAGGLISGGISGVLSGAAMGSLAGPVGSAVGAAVGGALGFLGGGNQAAQARDDAFKSYYSGLYDAQAAARQETLTSGSGIAAQRQTDLISFSTMFGSREAASGYLSDLVDMANNTPFLYDDLTLMSKKLATYKFGLDEILPVLQTVGDSGAALGLNTSDMATVATALGRMRSSNKTKLEYLNILSDRGIGAVGYLAEAKGVSVGDVYGMISKSQIAGTDAVEIILSALERDFGGAMLEQSKTFSGLSSTVEGLRQEVGNAAGEDYNGLRIAGLQEERDAYGGALGNALKDVNRIIGENAAYLDNLKEEYSREALSKVLLGEGTTLFKAEDRVQLSGMREAYRTASAEYEVTGSREAALKMQELTSQAQAVAQAAYESSDAYKMTQDAQAESLSALRANTSALEASTAAYSLTQERTKGAGAAQFQPERSSTLARISSLADPDLAAAGGDAWGLAVKGRRSHAAGLRRVPRDNYAAMLHEGERVLTASEVQEHESAQSLTIYVTGNTFGAGMDAEAVAEALADQIAAKLEAGNRG